MTYSKRKDFHFIVLNPKKIVRILQKDQIRSDQKKKKQQTLKALKTKTQPNKKTPRYKFFCPYLFLIHFKIFPVCYDI